MQRCAQCDGMLNEQWRFCIHCGSPILASELLPPVRSHKQPEATVDRKPETKTKNSPAWSQPETPKLDIPQLFSFMLGASGVLLIAGLAVVFYGVS